MKITIEIPDDQIPEYAEWIAIDTLGIQAFSIEPVRGRMADWVSESGPNEFLDESLMILKVKVARDACKKGAKR